MKKIGKLKFWKKAKIEEEKHRKAEEEKLNKIETEKKAIGSYLDVEKKKNELKA